MKNKLNLRLLCILFLVLDLLLVLLLFVSISRTRRDYSAHRDELELTMADIGSEGLNSLGRVAAHVSMMSEIKLEDGHIAIGLSNAEENNCAVSIEIILLDSGATIATSGLVDPGWRLEKIELDKQPDKGVHECLVRCLFYTMDGDKYIGRTARQMLLTVD